jgi:hypothetical protein
MFSDRKSQSGWWLDAGAIYVLTAALIFPLFRVNYLNDWESIESTFIADARLLRENWPHHLWQPLWYLGTRTDYVYPPGLRYSVAFLSWLLHASFAHAYHIFIALFYTFGMVGVYLWVRTAANSRGAAWLAAAGAALVAPCLWITKDFGIGSPLHFPWRLHVLISWGEGPHICSLAVLPIVWLGAWRRFHGGGLRWLLLSAGAAATAVTLNFYGATSLAITFPILVWACFLERRDWRILRDSLFIATLAYGLTAWWLTPSYLRITLRNLHLVAPPGRASSVWAFVLIVIAYFGASFGVRRWLEARAYLFFSWSTLVFLSLYILGNRWFGFQVAGDTVRMISEWDLFATLCSVTIARALWSWRPVGRLELAPRIATALITLLCFYPSSRYLRHAYAEFPADHQWQKHVEYRTDDWLWRNFPEQRVLVSGSIRFWYNVWHDGQQADGGSLQGMLLPLTPSLQWRTLHDDRPELVRHWLQAMGIDIVVVPGPASQEIYKDFTYASMYDRNFPLLYDDGAGNRFYRVPRRVPGIVRIVDRGKVLAAPPIPDNFETAQIAAYAEAVEAVPPGGGALDRAQGRWRGSDELDIDALSQPGDALSIEETFDPNWRAYVDGKLQPIDRDVAGLMLVDLGPGKHSVRLVFETPRETIAGRAATCATLVLILFLALRRRFGMAG